MKDLTKYRFGKIGNGNAVHIIWAGKTLCNASKGVGESGLTAKDVTCKRCINPMHKYKPYNDLVARAEKEGSESLETEEQKADTKEPEENPDSE